MAAPLAPDPPVVSLHDGTKLTHVDYSRLGHRAKENFNYAKVAAILADYGFTTMRLSDDWHGADFIAHNPKGGTLLVQLKGRLTIDKKYLRDNALQEIYVCFPTATIPRRWYLYHHDSLVKFMLENGSISREAWARGTGQSRLHPGERILKYLAANGCELGVEKMPLSKR